MKRKVVDWSPKIEARFKPHAGAYLAELRRKVEAGEAWVEIWSCDLWVICEHEQPEGCVPQLHILAIVGRGTLQDWPAITDFWHRRGWPVITCETMKQSMVRVLSRLGWAPVALELKHEVPG